MTNRKWLAIFMAGMIAISMMPVAGFATTIEDNGESVVFAETTEIDPSNPITEEPIEPETPIGPEKPVVPVKTWPPKGGTAQLTMMTCDGVTFNLTAAAKQKLYSYDTLQGFCTAKGYGYFSLYNRTKNKSKIVKVNMSTMQVVKVSGAKKIYHANSMTYNTRTNQIIIANGAPKHKRITIVYASNLKTKGNKTIKLPKKVAGMKKKTRKKYAGISAIAYNESKNVYVARMRKTNNLLILNSKFKVKKYIVLKGKAKLLYQGLDTYGNYTLDCQSFKGSKKYSLITIRNWNGGVVSKITIPKGKGLELEEVSHDGNTFYAGFYYTTNQKHDDKKHKVKRTNYIYRIENI